MVRGATYMLTLIVPVWANAAAKCMQDLGPHCMVKRVCIYMYMYIHCSYSLWYTVVYTRPWLQVCTQWIVYSCIYSLATEWLQIHVYHDVDPCTQDVPISLYIEVLGLSLVSIWGHQPSFQSCIIICRKICVYTLGGSYLFGGSCVQQ